jgi:iron complex outermembrane receptor protein
MKLPLQKEELTVSSAAKTEQSIHEAASLTNIVKRRQILDYGFFSLNQVLWQQAGFSVSRDFERYTPSFRGNFEGWNNNRMLVLIDGIPFNENINGAAWTFEGASPLVFTKSLEVVRGGVSALYGNNAMNGAVQMETRNASDIEGNVEARMRLGAETQIFDLIAGTENSKLSAVVAYNRFQSVGFNTESYDISGRTVNGQLVKFPLFENQESNYFFAKIKPKGKLQGLTFQFHEQQNSAQSSHGFLFAIPTKYPDEYVFTRSILAISYIKNIRNWRLELINRYQNNGLNWKINHLPDSSVFGGLLYPRGLTENLDVKMNDIFSRFQISRSTKKWGMWLLGWENTIYWKGREAVHTANANLDSDFRPTANNEFINLPSAFAFLDGNKILNNGWYAQYISPKWRDKISFTFALRYDNQKINYVDIYSPSLPQLAKVYEQVNPRMTIVYNPIPKKLFLRAIAGRSFRTPAISETVTANSFDYSSNLKELRPESTENYELITDYIPNEKWLIRLNGFFNSFKNLIFYSSENANLATNVYSAQSRGLESEVSYQASNIHFFANMGYVQRVSEDIIDKSIAESVEVTWVPSLTAKAGITYRYKKIYANAYLQYQGVVKRRSTDIANIILYRPITVNTQDYRPDQVVAWTNMTFKLGWAISKNIELSLWGSNLLNQEMFLAKNNAYTFDYRMPMRQVFFDLKINY